MKLLSAMNPYPDFYEPSVKDIRVPICLLDRKRNKGDYCVSEENIEKFYSTSYALPLYMYLYVKRDMCGVSTFSLNGFCKWMNIVPQTGRKGNVRQIYNTLCNFKDIGIIKLVPSLPERYYADKMLEVETTEIFINHELQSYAMFYMDELELIFNVKEEGQISDSVNSSITTITTQNTLRVLGLIRASMVTYEKRKYMFNHINEIEVRTGLCNETVRNAIHTLTDLHIIATFVSSRKKFKNGKTENGKFWTPKTLFVNCVSHISEYVKDNDSDNSKKYYVHYIDRSYKYEDFIQEILFERRRAKKRGFKGWSDSYAYEMSQDINSFYSKNEEYMTITQKILDSYDVMDKKASNLSKDEEEDDFEKLFDLDDLDGFDLDDWDSDSTD